MYRIGMAYDMHAPINVNSRLLLSTFYYKFRDITFDFSARHISSMQSHIHNVYYVIKYHETNNIYDFPCIIAG